MKGVNFEHSAVDGHTVLRFVSDVFADTIVRFASSVTGSIHGKDYLTPILDATYKKLPAGSLEPRKMEWSIPPSVRRSIRVRTALHWPRNSRRLWCCHGCGGCQRGKAADTSGLALDLASSPGHARHGVGCGWEQQQQQQQHGALPPNLQFAEAAISDQIVQRCAPKMQCGAARCNGPISGATHPACLRDAA